MGGIWGSKKKTKEEVPRPPVPQSTPPTPTTVLEVGEPGDDPEGWETALVARLLADFQQRQGIDLQRDEIAVKRVRAATERARLALATEQSTQLTLPFITADASGPKTLDAEIRKSAG